MENQDITKECLKELNKTLNEEFKKDNVFKIDINEAKEHMKYFDDYDESDSTLDYNYLDDETIKKKIKVDFNTLKQLLRNESALNDLEKKEHYRTLHLSNLEISNQELKDKVKTYEESIKRYKEKEVLISKIFRFQANKPEDLQLNIKIDYKTDLIKIHNNIAEVEKKFGELQDTYDEIINELDIIKKEEIKQIITELIDYKLEKLVKVYDERYKIIEKYNLYNNCKNVSILIFSFIFMVFVNKLINNL
jgi:hypothetical protein